MVEFGAEGGERGADGLCCGREGCRRGVAARGGEAGDEGGGEEGDDGEVGRFGAGEEGGGVRGVEEGGEGVGELREALEGVGAVAEGRFVRLGRLVFFGGLVAEEVGELLGEEGEVGTFILLGVSYRDVWEGQEVLPRGRVRGGQSLGWEDRGGSRGWGRNRSLFGGQGLCCL